MVTLSDDGGSGRGCCRGSKLVVKRGGKLVGSVGCHQGGKYGRQQCWRYLGVLRLRKFVSRSGKNGILEEDKHMRGVGKVRDTRYKPVDDTGTDAIPRLSYPTRHPTQNPTGCSSSNSNGTLSQAGVLRYSLNKNKQQSRPIQSPCQTCSP